MSLRNLQAEAGNAVLGMNVPDNFEHSHMLAAGGVVLAAAAGLALLERRKIGAMYEGIRYPNPAMQEATERSARSEKRNRTAATALIGLTAGAALMQLSDPSDTVSENKVDSVAVIVDSSFAMYADDVSTGEGTTQRLPAVVNTINDLELDGVSVSFIAAGSLSQPMGTVEDGKGKNEVVDNFTAYTDDVTYTASADIAGALSAAEASNPDRILIFTPSLEGVQAPQLLGEQEGDRVDVIAVGQSGTTIEYIDEAKSVGIDEKANDLLVGEQNSYIAGSTAELSDIIDEIITEKYVNTEETKNTLFAKIRNWSAGILLAGAAMRKIGFVTGVNNVRKGER